MVFLQNLTSTNFSDGFHYEENLWTKENGFHWPENPFKLAGMKDFLEKYFFTRRKKLLLAGVSKKWRKNRFPLAGKPVSPSRNKLPLAGIFLKN